MQIESIKILVDHPDGSAESYVLSELEYNSFTRHRQQFLELCFPPIAAESRAINRIISSRAPAPSITVNSQDTIKLDPINETFRQRITELS